MMRKTTQSVLKHYFKYQKNIYKHIHLSALPFPQLFSKRFYSSKDANNEANFMHVTVKDARDASNIGKKVTIRGWLKTLRTQKNTTFLEINDGSSLGNIQIVLDSNQLPSENIHVGCSIEASGEIIKSLGAGQATELSTTNIKIVGSSTPTYPLQKKRHSLEFMREIAHLRPRSNLTGAMIRVRNTAYSAIHEYFQENGFLHIHTPILTASDCEGAGEQFRVITCDKDPNEFFGRETFLTVSGQLEAEIFACSMSKVYTFGPTFRAEKGKTSRHLCEFWMMEMEEAFADLQKNCSRAEEMIKHVVKRVLEKHEEDLQFFTKWVEPNLMNKLNNVLKDNFATMTYTEAISVLQKSGKKFEFPVEWGCNLQSEHECYLCEEYSKRPTFVTDYPKTIKPFYARVNDDGKTVGAVDLLVEGIGEMIGGSVREERYDVLLKEMQEKKMKIEDYEWYLDLRKYGTVPHAGFGLGFERLIMFLTGIKNIRDVIPIPRAPGLCKF